jgi:hypothetical protein
MLGTALLAVEMCICCAVSNCIRSASMMTRRVVPWNTCATCASKIPEAETVENYTQIGTTPYSVEMVNS